MPFFYQRKKNIKTYDNGGTFIYHDRVFITCIIVQVVNDNCCVNIPLFKSIPNQMILGRVELDTKRRNAWDKRYSLYKYIAICDGWSAKYEGCPGLVDYVML